MAEGRDVMAAFKHFFRYFFTIEWDDVIDDDIF